MSRFFRTLLTVVVLALPLQAHAAEKIDPALERDIRTLLELTGTRQMMTQALDQMMAAMAGSLPGLTAKDLEVLRGEMNIEELEGDVVLIYAAHFTREDVGQLIAFYQSPIGQKLIKEQPAVMSESMTAGQKWGQVAAQRAMQKLQK